MKKLSYFLPALLLFFFSCEKDTDNTTMRINHYKSNCAGLGSATCFLVQEGDAIGTQNWSLLSDTIDGFKFEEGFITTLEIRKENIVNPPQDGSGIKYRLIKTISKTKAQE
jgi:hypothetical protein